MNITKLPTCFSTRRTRATAASLAMVILACPGTIAQDQEIIALDEMVVSASRSEQDIRSMPSSVTLLSIADLGESGIQSLQTALSQQPGVIVISSGAKGSQTSVFTRGASSHQTLFFVDGVRINDRSAEYQNLLGGAGLRNIERLEVLRGQQSTLYGSGATGGVVMLNTARGNDQFGGTLRAEAGSFNTIGGSATLAGAVDALGYSAHVSRLVTDNDRPGNSYKAWEYSGRVDYTATDNLVVGATLRGLLSDYEEPGSTLFPSPGVVDTKNHLATAYGELRINDSVTSRLTGGLHRSDYEFESTWGLSDRKDRREIIDWTSTWKTTENLEITGGVNYERSKITIGDTTSNDELLAAFASGVVNVNEAFTITAGLRNDHYDSAGGATTWRMGGSWQLTEFTRVRGTYGTGFVAPSAADRFGVPAWGQLPNPYIEPEKSRGWDIGIEHDFNFSGFIASATYFDNDFDNLLEWETVDFTTFEGMVVNRAEASTRGVELALAARPHNAVTTRIAYTYLRAKNDETGADLIRRPEHTIDAEVSALFTRRFFAGFGLRFVGNRVDSTGPLDDYATARLFGRYHVNEDLVVSARIENLFDKEYEEVAGYPALPIGAYAGIEWHF